jgi:hypothetical protein
MSAGEAVKPKPAISRARVSITSRKRVSTARAVQPTRRTWPRLASGPGTAAASLCTSLLGDPGGAAGAAVSIPCLNGRLVEMQPSHNHAEISLLRKRAGLQV